jgi:hypothetical protein
LVVHKQELDRNEMIIKVLTTQFEHLKEQLVTERSHSGSLENQVKQLE